MSVIPVEEGDFYCNQMSDLLFPSDRASKAVTFAPTED